MGVILCPTGTDVFPSRAYRILASSLGPREDPYDSRPRSTRKLFHDPPVAVPPSCLIGLGTLEQIETQLSCLCRSNMNCILAAKRVTGNSAPAHRSRRSIELHACFRPNLRDNPFDKAQNKDESSVYYDISAYLIM